MAISGVAPQTFHPKFDITNDNQNLNDMENKIITKNTPAWRFQVWAAFAIGLVMSCFGIWKMEADLWVKGYMLMGLLFTVCSCFALAKTLRDDAESERLINRIAEAKTQKIITDYED